jgi:hypothetical protein
MTGRDTAPLTLQHREAVGDDAGAPLGAGGRQARAGAADAVGWPTVAVGTVVQARADFVCSARHVPPAPMGSLGTGGNALRKALAESAAGHGGVVVAHGADRIHAAILPLARDVRGGMSATASPRPASTCRSRALWQVLSLPPANQRLYGARAPSSTRRGGSYQLMPRAASPQNASGSSSDRWRASSMRVDMPQVVAVG